MATATEPSPAVRLRNGIDAAAPLVAVTMDAVRKLLGSNPLAAYELVRLCRDVELQPWSKAVAAALFEVGLIERDGDGYKVHGGTRDIILAAVEGDEGDMHFVNPIARSEDNGSETQADG